MTFYIITIYLMAAYGLGAYLLTLSNRDKGELNGYDWIIFAFSFISAPFILIMALEDYIRERNEDLQ